MKRRAAQQNSGSLRDYHIWFTALLLGDAYIFKKYFMEIDYPPSSIQYQKHSHLYLWGRKQSSHFLSAKGGR